MRRATSGFLRLFVVVASYTALLALLTWPLASELTTHLPHTMGNFLADIYLVGWALAWQTHALSSAPTQMFQGNIYCPAPLSLFYTTPALGLLPVFAPIFLASGNPTLAVNGALILSLALTATTLHFVIERWTGSAAAGIAGATTFLVSKTALGWLGIIPHYAALAPLPLIIWMVTDSALRWPATMGLAGLVALQSLTDLVYVGPMLFLTLGIAAAAMMCSSNSRRRGGRVLVALGLAGCAIAPIYAGYIAVVLANPNLRQQTIWGTTSLAGTPFLIRSLLPRLGPLALSPSARLLASCGLLAGVTRYGAVTSERWRAWKYASLFFVVALGVSWEIPLLFPSLREALLKTVVRDPPRLAFQGLIGAALVGGLGFAACTVAVRRAAPASVRRLVPALLMLALMALRLREMPFELGAYPTVEAPRSGPEAAVLRTGHGPAVVLPTGRNGIELAPNAVAMYRSIDHWRPLLNGYSSYYPQGFAERMVLANRLPAPDALEILRRDWRLRTIVVQADVQGALIAQLRWLRPLALGTLPGVRIQYRDSTTLVLEIDPEDTPPAVPSGDQPIGELTSVP